MNLKEFFSFDNFLIEEGRKINIKRKYTENHPAKSVQFKTPVRNKILNFISEKEKVSRADLVEYINAKNEEHGRKTSFAWVRKNSHLIKKIVEKDGSTFYTLTKFGKKVLSKTDVSEDITTLQNTPGMNNTTAPTDNSVGSGDKFDATSDDCDDDDEDCKKKNK